MAKMSKDGVLCVRVCFVDMNRSCTSICQPARVKVGGGKQGGGSKVEELLPQRTLGINQSSGIRCT